MRAEGGGKGEITYCGQRREETTKSIIMFYNANICGKTLLVSLARHEKCKQLRQHIYYLANKKQGERKIGEQQIDRNNMVPTVRFGQEGQPLKKTLIGEVNAEFEEWPSRSLVCTTNEPRDLATLASFIINDYGQCTKICARSSLKFYINLF
ncbi:LOW QUALITY PROTEIN: hypothetical protein Cgig2_003220 [Carnegiea gigantea]|uniref:Uncharacterized protein n=1 Tax=Carnegiea gigantea TaxID=171969 RepID=A0A9Q1JU14_9CARY|nr:LOW QUALITY PROTEIN: hypothetical protein Cgig2_003220 [Carnegiea gigantea]